MLDALRAAIPKLSVRGPVREFALHGVEPNIVVEPGSVAEAAEVLRLASENEWRVECAGAATQPFGNRRTRADIVISTRALTDVVEYEAADLVIGVQAGMSLHKLQQTTRKHAQFLALDPPTQESSTVGGVLATGRSGPLRYAHGTPRDHVLGLQIITGDGRVLQLGGRVVKNVAGYDLVRLVVGSAGTLGLITSAYLRLKPVPQSEATVLISAGAPQPLLDLARRISEENLEAVAVELISAGSLTESWVLLVRLAGNQESVSDARARIEGHARALNAASQEGAEDHWTALGRQEATATTVVRLADLPSRLESTLELAQKLSNRIDGRSHMVAHAGDGIVRVVIGDSSAEATAFAIGEARAVTAVTNGTTTVHSRDGDLMRRVDAFGVAGPAMSLMQRLKQAFDPAGILAPGRFVV